MISKRTALNRIKRVRQWVLSFVKTRYVTAKYTGEGLTEGEKYKVVLTKYHHNLAVEYFTVIDDNDKEASWLRQAFNGF